MLISSSEIDKLYLTAVKLRLYDRRSALIAGIDPAYLAGLEQSRTPSDQMLLDLRAMNVTDRVIGSDIPLKQWLDNANLIKGTEADDFAELAETIFAQSDPSVSDAQQRARTTLETLQSLAGSNDGFRRLLAAASQQFEAIAGSVKLLVAYKGLHDFLHDIQVFRLPLIQATLPESGSSNWTMLKPCIDELKFKLDDARREKIGMLNADSPARRKQERWLAEFEEICQRFYGAIEKAAADRARDALTDLRSLIRFNMSSLNLLLSDVAGRLGIGALVERLRSFAGSLEVEDARAAQLREAATQLFLLQSEIDDLLGEHDRWQQIDDKLWSAEDNLLFGGGTEFELRSFSRLWPTVVELVAKIAQTETAEWYLRVKQYADSFGINCPLPVTPPIPDAALEQFREYTRSARNQFYYIDSELKIRCNRLTQIAEPLEELARAQ